MICVISFTPPSLIAIIKISRANLANAREHDLTVGSAWSYGNITLVCYLAKATFSWNYLGRFAPSEATSHVKAPAEFFSAAEFAGKPFGFNCGSGIGKGHQHS